jgi:hypothetical protein
MVLDLVVLVAGGVRQALKEIIKDHGYHQAATPARP